MTSADSSPSVTSSVKSAVLEKVAAPRFEHAVKVCHRDGTRVVRQGDNSVGTDNIIGCVAEVVSPDHGERLHRTHNAKLQWPNWTSTVGFSNKTTNIVTISG